MKHSRRTSESALAKALQLPFLVTEGKLARLELKIPWTDLANKPTFLKLDGLSINATVTDTVHISEIDELAIKRSLLDHIESRREAKAIAAQANNTSDTASEAYFDRILRNLHVEISSITVNIVDEKLQGNFGFHLNSLSLRTTNENWTEEASGVMNNAPVFKVAQMSELGIFITPMGKAMQHILEPLTMVSHIKHKLHAGEKEEKGSAELTIEELKLRLSREQFKFTARLFEKLERVKRKARFDKYRPRVGVRGNAREWWKYAFKTIKDQHGIDQKVQLFSRQYIQNYCVNRSSYRQIFESKIQDFNIEQAELDRLETCLDISTIIEIREAIKLKVRQTKTKASNQGWFGGWFGSNGTVDSTSYEISNEDRERLASLIAIDESALNFSDKPGVKRYSLKINMPTLKIELENLIEIQFHDSLICFESYPGSKSSALHLETKRFDVENLSSDGNIVTSRCGPESDVFFEMDFVFNPFDAETLQKVADQSLTMRSGGVDINIDHRVLSDVQRLFEVPDEANLTEFSTAIQQEYSQRAAQTRAGLSHIISTRNVFLISLDMKAPNITIPGPSSLGESPSNIVLNFGRLVIETNKAKICQDFDQSKYQIQDLEKMAYANYDMRLEDLQLMVYTGKVTPTSSILTPFSITLKLERLDSKAQATVDLPKYRVFGQINEFNVRLSNIRLVQMRRIQNFATNVWTKKNEESFTPLHSETILPTAPEFVNSERAQTRLNALANLDQVESVYLFDSNLFAPLAGVESGEDIFYDAPESSLSSKPSTSCASEAIQLELNMIVNSVLVNLIDEMGISATKMLQLSTGELTFNHKQRKYGTETKGLCASLDVTYEPDSIKRMLILEMGDVEGEESNSAISFVYHKDNQADVIETSLVVDSECFICTIDPLMINSVMRFINSMYLVSDAGFPSPTCSESTMAGSSARQLPAINVTSAQTISSTESMSSQKELPTVQSIVINSAFAQLNMLHNSEPVSQFRLTGTAIETCFRNESSVYKLKVSQILLSDMTDSGIYERVIYVENAGETFFDLTMTMHNDVDDSSFTNLGTTSQTSDSHGELRLRAGALHINFFYKFMDHLAFHYATAVSEAFNTDFDLTLLPEISNSSRYLLDVEINAPKIFMPESQSSEVGILADLGFLSVNNRFKLYEVSSPDLYRSVKKPPIQDRISVKLQDLRLYRVQDGLKKVSILDQDELNVTIIRNLSSRWFFDQPEMEIKLTIPKLQLNLSKVDLEVFWKVLYQNLMGRFSSLEFNRTSKWVPERVGTSAEQAHEIRLTLTDTNGKTVPGVSAAGNYLTVDDALDPSDTRRYTTRSSVVTDNQPQDYELMTVDFEMQEVKTCIYSDPDHSSKLTLTRLESMTGQYASLKNEEMSVNFSIGNLLLKDLRNINTTHMPVYLVQKQVTEDESEENPLIKITYTSFPREESQCQKQIVSIKIKDIRAILILDLCVQLNDILVNSMPSAGVDDSGETVQVTKETVRSTQLKDALTAEELNIPMYEYSDEGVDKKPLENATRLQLYVELEKPHVLIVTDMTNRSSSVLKVGCDLRMTYIASLKEQNLDFSLLQTEMACVPFKYSFNTNETLSSGITVLNGVDFDFSVQFGDNSTSGRCKCSDFELTLTPAVLSTIFLAYQFLLGSTEQNDTSASKTTIEEYVPLHCQRVIEPSKIWFLPNPIGSDVDVKLSPVKSEKILPKREENFDIDLPKIVVRLESHMFYDRSTSVVFLPLFRVESKLRGSVESWSSELRAEMNWRLAADVYHESRPGYERLLEPVEDTRSPSNDFNWFEIGLIYTSYNQRSRVQHTSPGFIEDDFEHTDKLPKEKLIIETRNSFNLNISNETIRVANHLVSAFSESLNDMQKTSSLNYTVGSNSHGSVAEDIRAPITVDNQTGHDIILITPQQWKDFDPSSSDNELKKRSSTLSPQRRNNLSVIGVPNANSFLSIVGGETDSTAMYKLSSTPLYFHVRKKRLSTRRRTRTPVADLKSEIITIEPAGFTRRQIDVIAQGELPIEFVSNMNPELKITLVVNVESLGGTKRITLKTTFVVDNRLPLPVRVLSPDDPKSEFYVSDADQINTQTPTLPIRCFSPQKALLLELADFGYAKQRISYSSLNPDQTFEKTLSFGSDGDIFYAAVSIKLSSFMKSPTQFKYNMTISPCFSVRNWLPYTITVKFDSDVNDYSVESGRSLPIIRSKIDPRLYVSFRNSPSEGEVLYESESIQVSTPSRLTSTRDDISLFKFRQPTNSNYIYLRRKITWTPSQARLEIFSPAWIVNKTGLVLQYHISNQIGRDEKVMHLGDVPFMLLPTKQREISISCDRSGKSEKFSISAVGSQGTVFCPAGGTTERRSYLLGKDITSATFGLTTIVTITSFYHLFNRTDQNLEIGEVEVTPPGTPTGATRWISIPAKSKHIFWPRKNAEKRIRVRIAKSNFVSRPIAYEANDQGVLLHMGDVTGIFAEISNTDNECAISFSPYFPGSAAFNIINLTGFPVLYRQNSEKHSSSLQSCNSVLYTWNEPTQNRDLYIEVTPDTTVASDRKEGHKSNTLFPSRDMARNVSSLSVTTKNATIVSESGKDALTQREIVIPGAMIYIIPVFIGAQRTIIITQDKYHSTTLADSDKQVTNFDLELKVQSITISLIDYVRRREVAVAHILGTGVTWYQQVKGQKKWREVDKNIAKLAEQSHRMGRQTRFRCGEITVDTKNMSMVKGDDNKRWTLTRAERCAINIRYKAREANTILDVKIQNLQVDNCLKVHKWPVVMAQMPREETVVAQDIYDREFILVQIIWGTANERKMKRYRKFHVLVQEFFVNLEIDFALSLVGVFSNEIKDRYGEAEIYRLFEDDINCIENALASEQIEDTRINGISFFEQLHLSPLKFAFKFNLESEDEEIMKANSVINWMKSLGLTIVTKGQVDFRLAFFDHAYQYFSDNELTATIWRHYKFQIVQQLYKVIFGLQILGNPMKVAFDMSQGVKNLFYEPYHGMRQSGDEFLEGMQIGANKFFSGVVGGSAGGLNKITHNLGSLAATVSFDKNYRDSRTHDANNAPQGVAEGVVRGFEKFGKGVFGGITGIATKPVQGAKKEGAAGFFKGIGQGLAGVVAKPLTGVADLTSNTLAGIQSQLDSTVEVRSVRKPRVMDENPLQPYRERLAHAQDILWQLASNYSGDSSSQVIDYSIDIPRAFALTNQRRLVVIVTNNHVMLIDTRDALGRLKPEWIKKLNQNLNIQFGGANSEYTLQVKDSRVPKVAKFSSRSEMDQIKDAINEELQSTQPEQFESLV